MRAFLAAVLSVIAVGILAIAYGLFNPRPMMAANGYPLAQPMLANDRVGMGEAFNAYNPYAPAAPAAQYAGYNYPYAANPYAYNGYGAVARPMTYPDVRAVPAYQSTPVYETYPSAPRVRTVRTSTTRVIDERPHRSWQKTALVIGGSTAAGAGVGGAFAGKKGALIGAALGGGISSLFEANKR